MQCIVTTLVQSSGFLVRNKQLLLLLQILNQAFQVYLGMMCVHVKMLIQLIIALLNIL